MRKRTIALLLAAMLLLAGCGAEGRQEQASFAPSEENRLVIFTSHRKEIYEPLIREFEQRTGIWVELETGGTTALLERIAKGDTGCDLMLGGGVDSLGAYADCFDPYTSIYNDSILPQYRSEDNRFTPVSALPLVLIYNTKLVRRNMPSGWSSLLDKAWYGRIAFADPSVSGSSYTALATMLQALGGDYADRLKGFKANLGGKLLPSSGDVVSSVAEGNCYIGVTLEETALNGIAAGYNIAIVYPEEGTSVLPDGAAIVAGCAHRESAQAFIDFLLCPDTQHLLPELLYRRSVCTDSDMKSADGGEIRLIDYDLAWSTAEQPKILSLWNGG